MHFTLLFKVDTLFYIIDSHITPDSGVDGIRGNIFIEINTAIIANIQPNIAVINYSYPTNLGSVSFLWNSGLLITPAIILAALSPSSTGSPHTFLP